MLSQQPTAAAYLVIKEKLKQLHLSTTEITKVLAGLSADRATSYLCQCVAEEEATRKGREKATLIFLGIGLTLWTALNASWGTIVTLGWPLFLVGPLLISLSIWLSQRRYSPLRDNALIGLTQVILDVRERETLVPLCTVAPLLNGTKHSWEVEIEEAIRSTIARLLTRLSPDEAALLPDPTREFLLAAIVDQRHTELTVSALLTLGSARDEAPLSYAETLRTSRLENVREAASEYLREVRGNV